MSPAACPHEREVLDLVAIGQWPTRADDSLRQHVSACPECADLAVVAVAMAELADGSRAGAHVPDAGLVWYRAQLAARDERVRRAARPLVLVQTLAGLAVLGLALIAWRAATPWILQWWNSLPPMGGPGASLPGLTSAFGEQSTAAWRWVGVAALVWIAAIPAVFYIAGLADRDSPTPADRQHQP